MSQQQKPRANPGRAREPGARAGIGTPAAGAPSQPATRGRRQGARRQRLALKSPTENGTQMRGKRKKNVDPAGNLSFGEKKGELAFWCVPKEAACLIESGPEAQISADVSTSLFVPPITMKPTLALSFRPEKGSQTATTPKALRCPCWSQLLVSKASGRAVRLLSFHLHRISGTCKWEGTPSERLPRGKTGKFG